MWANEPMTAIAIATTGTDPATARLVAISHRTVNDARNDDPHLDLVNTGAPIPDTASRIHGITDTTTGHPPAQVLANIEHLLAAARAQERPVVMFHHIWTLEVLQAEAARANYPLTIPAGLVIIDPLIIDRRLTPRRRAGNRTLQALCRAWGVDTGQFGHPNDNVNAVLRLAWRMGTLHPTIRDMSLPNLAHAQATWHREDEEQRIIHYASRGKEHHVVSN